MIYQENGAVFSNDKKYRYLLWRILDEHWPRVLIVGPNPSNAGVCKDDPHGQTLHSACAAVGLPDAGFTISHSATGSASDTDLPTDATLSAANQVTVPPAVTKWQTKLNAANGTFTGGFELLDAGQKRKTPFSGVLRQPAEAADSVIGDGHFLLPALPGAPSNERLSGEVLFQRP